MFINDQQLPNKGLRENNIVDDDMIEENKVEVDKKNHEDMRLLRIISLSYNL